MNARLDRFGSLLWTRLAALAIALIAWPGCGDAPQARQVDAPPPGWVAANEARSGRYELTGVTVQAQSGEQREISGTLELDVQSARYEVSFELETTAPGAAEPIPVSVRGSGRGFIVGDVFTGTTDEWMSLVPPASLEEVVLHDVELPAKAGRKLVSTSRASFDPDGTMNILMENYPAPGEQYEASMTVLEGRRIAAAP